MERLWKDAYNVFFERRPDERKKRLAHEIRENATLPQYKVQDVMNELHAFMLGLLQAIYHKLFNGRLIDEEKKVLVLFCGCRARISFFI